MKKIRWWLRIVGCWYLLMVVVFFSGVIVSPEVFPTFWGPSPRLSGFPMTLTYLTLGLLMLYFSRNPARASVLMLAVALIELVAWVSFDIVGSIRYGFELSGPGIVWLFTHCAIGISGLLFYKRSASATSAGTGANAS